jgi:glycosyltransferase involved in cell wall biosynthesis
MRPQIVYCRSSFLDFIAISVLRIFFGFTYVAEVNGIRSLETTGNYAKRYLVAWMERISIGFCDKVVAVTPELREWAFKTGKLRPEQTATIGNGVSVELFHPIPSLHAKQMLGLDLDLRYLTFTSSLKPWHGTQLLIEALSIFLGEFPSGIRLLIVGDGPEKVRMVKLARRLGVNHAIDWVGHVSINKVPLYINAGEICLAPFTLERNAQTGISPIKIFEYMACSRPFITTRVETTYDNLIEACHCGVLVPPNDTTALAAAVVKLLQNPKQRERMGQQGRRIAVERYSWAKIAEQIEQFITQPRLLSNKQNYWS